ncbi:MAG TPA: hypothetical protein VFN23_02590 [Ktedonobacteraceae bacterium]|nr:hypothetical protein [Ktedonobacteraceae bacterium]
MRRSSQQQWKSTRELGYEKHPRLTPVIRRRRPVVEHPGAFLANKGGTTSRRFSVVVLSRDDGAFFYILK